MLFSAAAVILLAAACPRACAHDEEYRWLLRTSLDPYFGADDPQWSESPPCSVHQDMNGDLCVMKEDGPVALGGGAKMKHEIPLLYVGEWLTGSVTLQQYGQRLNMPPMPAGATTWLHKVSAANNTGLRFGVRHQGDWTTRLACEITRIEDGKLTAATTLLFSPHDLTSGRHRIEYKVRMTSAPSPDSTTLVVTLVDTHMALQSEVFSPVAETQTAVCRTTFGQPWVDLAYGIMPPLARGDESWIFFEAWAKAGRNEHDLSAPPIDPGVPIGCILSLSTSLDPYTSGDHLLTSQGVWIGEEVDGCLPGAWNYALAAVPSGPGYGYMVHAIPPIRTFSEGAGEGRVSGRLLIRADGHCYPSYGVVSILHELRDNASCGFRFGVRHYRGEMAFLYVDTTKSEGGCIVTDRWAQGSVLLPVCDWTLLEYDICFRGNLGGCSINARLKDLAGNLLDSVSLEYPGSTVSPPEFTPVGTLQTALYGLSVDGTGPDRWLLDDAVVSTGYVDR